MSEKLQQKNLEVFMEIGPRLSTRYSTWVVARDRKRNRVLVGGLGCMGCGQMWGPESEDTEKMDGYGDAPEADSWMGFGTSESNEQMLKSMWENIR